MPSSYARRLQRIEAEATEDWDLSRFLLWVDGKTTGAPKGPIVKALADVARRTADPSEEAPSARHTWMG